MSANTTKAEYFAFISHKSADAKYARKMQKFIEGYNLPAKIRENSDIPKRLSPICSYEVDFSPNPLSEEMREKLKRSKFLIVLCSEALVKGGTKYVNYEIETFMELKRAEGIDPLSRIIPIIVSGSIDAEEQSCFPEALKALGEDCPIAINRKNCESDRDVFFYAISGMLDIDFIALKNRDKKRRIKSRIALAVLTTFALLIAAFLAEYYIPRKYHYLDFVTEYGIPAGIGRLSKNEYRMTSSHYVITKHKHRIVSLEHVNSSGHLTDHSNFEDADRPAKYVYDYTDSSLSSVTYYDKSNNPYFILQYSGGSVQAADIKDPYMPDKPFYIPEGYEKQPSALLADNNMYFASNISRFEYTYNENGHITKITFHSDSTGRLASDAYVFGFEYTLDEKGRITKKHFLDAKGEYRLNSEGIFCKAYAYDESNDRIEIKNINSDGTLAADSDGLALIKNAFDRNHNVIQTDLYNKNGDKAVITSYGGATQKQRRNKNGACAEVLLYDEKGNFSQFDGYCGKSYAYDKNGFKESETFIDSFGDAITHSVYKYSRIEYVNDENGNPLKILYCDATGNLINNNNGYACEIVEYNEYGKVVKRSYYDSDGSLADYCGYGYSTVISEYDNYGRETSSSYFDIEEKPVNISGPAWEYGYHKAESVYEYGANTKISIAYYDKDGNKVNALSEAMGETYASAVIYVQNSEITSFAAYHADGTKYGESYDVEVEYSTKAEKITTTTHRNSADEITMTVKTTDYINGVKKSSVLTDYQDGMAVMIAVLTYDESGSQISEEYVTYDSFGNELVKSKTTFDRNGNAILQESFDNTKDAYYYATQSTFEGRSLVKMTAVGKDINDNILFTSQTDYREDGRTYTQDSYKNNALSGTVIFEYDENNNTRSIINRSYSENGSLQLESITTYNDDASKTVRYYYYDESGNVLAESETEYDSKGNVINR